MNIDLNNAKGQHKERSGRQQVDEWPRVESALQFIDADDRETWVRTGQAIQDEFGEAGFPLWDDWSRTGDNYSEQAARDVWRSFGQGGGVTIASLFHLARENGWTNNTQAPRLTSEQVEARQRSKEEARRLNAEEKARTQAEAAKTALTIYNNADANSAAEHPYAVRKRLDFGSLVRRGEYLGHDCLIVPLYGEDGALWSVQGIAAVKVFGSPPDSRDKTTIKDGRTSGCFFPIGPTFRGSKRVHIVEGLATGAAVHAATGEPVVMAISTSNLTNVGEVVRRLAAPGAEIVFCADDDQKPGTDKNPGIEAAKKAAEAVGGKVAVPDMGKKADFWDLWNEQGPEAVRKCINAACEVETEQKQRLTALRRDDLLALPDIDWIIKGVMPSRGVGVVYGPSTVGKSFLEVDKAAALAEGLDWFGFRIKKRPVVYACLEGQHGFRRRVMAWEAHNGRCYPSGVVFAPDPIDLRTDQDTDALIALARAEAGQGAVVIIDTLNRAAPGMEENGSVDYGLILANACKIEQAVGGFVCFVGHPGKDASKGLRGHYSMVAGLDMVLEVEEVNREELSFAWTTRKVKDGQDGIKRHFRRDVIDLGQDADGDPVTSCVIIPDPEADGAAKTAKAANISRTNRERFEGFRQAAMEYGTLDDAGNFIGLEKDGWRVHFYLNSHSENKDATRTAFGTAVKELKKIGLIYDRADGLFQFDGPGAETQAEVIRAAIEERTRGKSQGQNGDRSERSEPKKSEESSHAKDRRAKRSEAPSLEGLRASHDSGANSGSDKNQTEEILNPSSPGTINQACTSFENAKTVPANSAEVAI